MSGRGRGGQGFGNQENKKFNNQNNKFNNKPPNEFYRNGCAFLENVRLLEDRTAAKPRSTTQQSQALQRPAYGTLGQAVSLWANYVALTPGRGHLFYRYSISITRIKDNNDKKQDSTKVPAEQSSNNEAAELASQVADQLTLNPNSNDPPSEPGIQPGNGDTAVQPAGMKRAAIIAHLLGDDRDLKDRFNRGTVASDYRDIMVSTTPLEDLVYPVNYKGVRSNYRLEKYRVALMEPSDVQNPLKLDDLLDYLGSDTRPETTAIPEAVFAQVLNIWLRQFSKFKESIEPPTQKVVASKAYPLTDDTTLPKDHPNFYFTQPLQSGIASIRGYFSSIRFGAGKAWVNINTTHGAFFESKPLGEWIRDAGYAHPRKHAQLHGILRGLRVELLHRTVKDGDDNKPVVKVISGLATTSDGPSKDAPEGNPSTTFPPPKFVKGSPAYGVQCAQVLFYDPSRPGDGYVTVYDHFKQKYRKYTPKQDELVVNLGSARRPTYYPVSVCKLLPGQPYHPKLTDTQTQAMIKFAQLGPKSSVDCITVDGFDRIGLKNPTAHAKLLNPASGLARAQGRILAMPGVKYNTTKVKSTPGKWNLLDVGEYSKKGRKAAWTFVSFGKLPWYDADYTRMDKQLRPLMAKRGFNPQDEWHMDDRYLYPPLELTQNSTIETRRKELAKHFKDLHNKGCNLLFVMLPDKGAEMYNAVKAAADITVGIHTVCIVEPNAARKFRAGPLQFSQFFDNILLKANLKQGGINHTLEFPTSTILSKWQAMVLGLDVTHSPQGANKANATPSIIGMVANADEHLAQWPATIAFQDRENQEIVTSMQSFQTLLQPHLDRYYGRHKKYPAALIIYRDGVSEGQYSHVAENEYNGIRSVCTAAYGSKNQPGPKISIIVVGKRHHTRFFPTAADHADSKGNTRPGTVVDRSITSQFLWEFYMQAHEAIQGTARPAHYVVVKDEFFRSTFSVQGNRPSANPPYKNAADVLEAFTHALSYAFGRSTRSIGVCTPARLADKVCDRARCYTAAGLALEEIKVAEDLKDSMFYI
ncbi:ribonuclease H-like domain-containing protein [Chaetomium tenue]|uniref:Ribonuclease H-like domain-containing protein n=1 Tax=Chaetomium tenue TaxID=1854479 RepID=A0ACB7PKN2_9PEZI|nr:ribonuclease H-like domain-containing protein [Chaetomium globosum]